MKGPMKGATIGHSKQRIRDGRYIGTTEPGIIAAEPPNPIVNQLVTMPDIEKRLEAFVRARHAIVVFPGGAGTAEEILYLLGFGCSIQRESAAAAGRVPGPAVSRRILWSDPILQFVRSVRQRRALYKIVIGRDPPQAARDAARGVEIGREYRPLQERPHQLQLAVHIRRASSARPSRRTKRWRSSS